MWLCAFWLQHTGEHKSNFYDAPELYVGKWGLGHFGEDTKGHGSKKGYKLELQSETAAYDDEGYDRCANFAHDLADS
jgi:hypothetical protein